MCAGLLVLMFALPNPSPAGAASLFVSASSDRTNASLLAGATLTASTPWYIFLSPGPVAGPVTFILDGSMFVHTEAISPWDFAGSIGPTGPARPYTFTPGGHAIRAQYGGGDITTNFTVIGPATPSSSRIPGRIAVSSDGNWHDYDDMLATAITVALLAKSGHAGQLVYYGHSDHLWATDAEREERMRVSAVETARMWGGFDLDNFYNARAQTSAAVARLAAEINGSSASSPLWIIAAGPMEVVGRALQASDRTRHPYVHLISHSTWNDNHAVDGAAESPPHTCCYTWQRMRTDFPTVSYHHIQDQNAGLNAGFATYAWLRDSADVRLRWLWCRSQPANASAYGCAEFSGFAGGSTQVFFDPSDSGMVYWLIHGGYQNTAKDSVQFGDQVATPDKLRVFFDSVTPPAALYATVRINAGGGAFIDALGQVWAADTNFSGGVTYSTIQPIAGTVDHPLYQTERYGNFSYQIPVDNGDYEVRLHFAEIFWTSVGARLFDVTVENLVVDNLDIWLNVGGLAPLMITVPVSVTDGVLDLMFTTVIDNAKVSAIEVRPLGVN